MKKLFVSICSFASSTIVFGQGSTPKIPTPPQHEMVHFANNNTAIEALQHVFPIILLVTLVILVTRYILDYRLRNKIIDRGISEQLASSLLEKSATDKKEDSIKWAFLLLGLSGGLIVTYYTMPLDIHSLAIIAFSIGVSFLSYYFFLKHSKQ